MIKAYEEVFRDEMASSVMFCVVIEDALKARFDDLQEVKGTYRVPDAAFNEPYRYTPEVVILTPSPTESSGADTTDATVASGPYVGEGGVPGAFRVAAYKGIELPAGLAIDEETGEIFGVPLVSGNHLLWLEVASSETWGTILIETNPIELVIRDCIDELSCRAGAVCRDALPNDQLFCCCAAHSAGDQDCVCGNSSATRGTSLATVSVSTASTTPRRTGMRFANTTIAAAAGNATSPGPTSFEAGGGDSRGSAFSRWAGRWWIVVVSVVLVVVLGFAVVVVFRRCYDITPKKRGPATSRTEDARTALFLIERGDVELLEEIGNGRYSKVYCAQLVDPHAKDSKSIVAAKLHVPMLGSEQQLLVWSAGEVPRSAELAREASLLKTFQHHNVIKFVGYVPGSSDGSGGPTMLLMDYCYHGSLKFYLNQRRLYDNDSQLNVKDRLDACYEIAQGMSYIHDQGYFHGNLKTDVSRSPLHFDCSA